MTSPPRRRFGIRTGLGSWLAIGVVFAIVGTIVLVKVAGGGPSVATQTSLSPAPSTVRAEVTHVPERVFDAVGVSSGVVPVFPPTVLSRPDPSKKPFLLFIGTEYCSFCAAERWPLIVALSRFGTFGTIYDMESTSIDYAPGTPTFSFYGTSYRSPDLAFHAYEVRSDVVVGPRGYEPLMRLSAKARTLWMRYDPGGEYPFVDVDNEVVVLQAELSPETFAQTTREQVAAGLADAANPITQGIVAAANYLSAAICHADADKPARVCGSPGVRAATAALRLSP